MSDILENAKTNVCDMVLCYHRKIKQLILGRYCRYQRFEADDFI